MTEQSDPLTVAWERVRSKWDDDAAHQAFLLLARELQRLPEAGRLYKEVRDSEPDRAERAQRQIGALVLLATEQLTASTVRPSPRSLRWLQALGFAIAVGLVLFFVSRLTVHSR